MNCVYDTKYSLTTIGLKKDKEYRFTSRNSAERKMYSIMDKLGLKAVKVYDDTHVKTYTCADGTRFVISRAF